MVMTVNDRSEIAFFDVETTVPTRTGQGFAILEFGAILVCPRKLVELRSYSTLVRPADLSHITSLSVRCNGITKDAVVSSPTFADIADMVYDLLQGVYLYNDVVIVILCQMATLATYFGLGQQTHRSLDDVRMNLEVLKYCATVLFWILNATGLSQPYESSLPDIFTENSWVSPNATTRSRSDGKISKEQTAQNESTPSSSIIVENHSTSSPPHHMEGNHPILLLMSPNTGEVNLSLIESNPARADPLNLSALAVEIEKEPLLEDNMEEEKTDSTSQESSTAVGYGHPNGCNDFLEPDDISIPSISVTLVPFYRGTQKIQILHQNSPLQLQCVSLKVRFGISTKFVDHAGRPRLNFVVDAPLSVCKILETTDSLAKKLSIDSGSSSEWRPVVIRKRGFFNSPILRLHLPTVADGETTRCATEIYQKDSSATQRIVFRRFDVNELDSLFTPGNIMDACFSLDVYDYQQNAGIRLVAKKLTVHSS
ncbi:hypothetical protein DH2020_043075 [Rehmannia glutinosa]|uniref:Exonuclease domain-containing protein n=1 Tax=Rehmannia glutinosa TaxID=99300 RepID=A0ABR0UKL9_REHGL